jgi:TPR repeat protein
LNVKSRLIEPLYFQAFLRCKPIGIPASHEVESLGKLISDASDDAKQKESQEQEVAGWMAKNGNDTPLDITAAARYYELSADHSSVGAFHLGRCCSIGRGIPIDFTLAAEFFLRAADSGDLDGERGFGCYVERDKGVDATLNLLRSIIARFHLNPIYPGCTSSGAVLSMALGLNMI